MHTHWPALLAAAAIVLTPAVGWAQDARADSLRAEVGRLKARMDSLEARIGAVRAQAADTSGELAALRAAAGGVPPADSVPQAPAPAAAVGPRGANLLNPEISATGDVRLVARDESPQTDNAIAREFEFSFQSALDPYSKTKIFLTFEDEEIEVEEGYIYWTGLPGGIRADVGKFRQQIGDLNRWHLHALPETEYPLVYQRFLGEEGLSGIGVSLYAALPISLGGGTHEVYLQGTTSESEPLYAGGREPTLLGRIQNFWQLSRASYAQLGFTATGGNNGDADLRSRLLGLDFRFTWRPPRTGTRENVTFRAEGYRLHSSELGVVTDRYGAFADLQVQSSRRWIFGARYDWAEAPRGLADTEWRITPAITWWQSEFVYLRLQGEHRRSDLAGTENLLTAQIVWAMGPHKHETY
jgi:outer membrane murein-binding lipoprotein Lpp